MKLFELYETTEENNTVPSGGSLTALLRGFVGVISQSSGNPNQYNAVQQALANHTLVTGMDETGHYILGNKAWTGGETGEWTPQLAQAINAWKASINYQLAEVGERNRLETNATAPSINQRDVEYLLAPLTSDGLLRSGREDRVQRYTGPDTLNFEGQTYVRELQGTVEDVDTTTRSMLDAIGWSGWYIICQAIARERVGEDADNARWDAETVRCMRAVYNQISYTPDRWYQNFKLLVLGSRTDFTIPVNGQPRPMFYTDNFAPTARDLYLFYAPIAEDLWAEELAQIQAAREQQAETQDMNASTLQETDVDRIAGLLQRALMPSSLTANALDLFDFGESNELDDIRNALNMMQTAQDYRDVADKFAENTGEDLNEQVMRELSREEYELYFVTRLSALRVVAPMLNFAAIQWNERTEIIIEGYVLNEVATQVRVQRERASDGSFRIVGYDGANDYDIFIIDDIIKTAVETSGGTLPDLNAPVEESAMLEAAALFIVAINASYPEMTTFYSYGPPFSTTEVPNIGRVQRIRIQSLMARMIQAGSADSDAIATAVTEIGRDREWLIGDGTEENPGAARIYFNQRYQNDGIEGRLWTPSGLDDEVELTDDEVAIYEGLTSTNEADREDAIRDIFDAADRDRLYNRLYRYSIRQGTALEDLIGEGQDSVERIVFSTPNEEEDGNIARLADELGGLPNVAPMALAKMFQDRISGTTTGSENAEIETLINLIDNREEYELINERYISLSGVGTSLWNDIDNETFDILGDDLKAALAARIGEDYEETASADLDSVITDAWNTFNREPSLANAQRFDEVIRDKLEENRSQAIAMLNNISRWLNEYDSESSNAINPADWPDTYRAVLPDVLEDVLVILRGNNPAINGGLFRYIEDLVIE
jgi:hypothetical protein